MSLTVFPIALAICALLALGTGIWLIVHAASVARAFGMVGRHGRPVRASQSKTAVWVMIIIFNLSWIGAVGIWVMTAEGEANEVVEASV